jgi:hypothetical protein
MPKLEHPLLSTPLADMPGPPARYRPAQDPLVGAVLAQARQKHLLDAR